MKVPEGTNRMKNELTQLLALKDARIAELEKALREIAAFKPGTFWGLQDEIKIHETASNALMER